MSTDEHLVNTLAYAAAAVLLGFQLLFFVAAKAFAITEGLLPEDESFDRWFKFVTRETGLIVGVLLMLVGLGVAASSVVSWAHTGYGSLPPVAMMWRTLPAMMCLMLRIEGCFGSFFLSCWAAAAVMPGGALQTNQSSQF